MIVRQPWVLLALTLLAVPIAIHLLVRAPARTVDLPSLRFVRRSRMRALRRRLVEDAGLLAVRALVLAAAVLALADPLVVTACRRSAWDGAMRTAVVLHDVAPEVAVVRQALAGSRIAVSTTDLAEGLWRARTQLARAGPGRREIVVVSRFAADSVDANAVRAVPDDIGLRFVRDGTAPPAAVSLAGPVWTSAGGRVPVSVTLSRTATRLLTGAPAAPALEVDAPGEALVVPAFGLRIEHGLAPAAGDVRASHAARAALQSVIATGVAVPAADEDVRRRPLVLRVGGQGGRLEAPAAWMGSVVRTLAEDPELTSGAAAATAAGGPLAALHVLFRDRDGVPLVSVSTRNGSPASLVIDLHVTATAPFLPLFVQRLMATRVPRVPVPSDPMSVDAAQLAAWSRPAKPTPAANLPDEWSDRRWAWSLVLGLLGIEWWWRRGRRGAGHGAIDANGGQHAA